MSDTETLAHEAQVVPPWWRRLTWSRVIVVLVVAHVVVKLALLQRAGQANLIGDEAYYVDSGKALGNLLRDLGAFHSPDRAELDRSVVGSGWFMPGMSVVLSPLFLLVPHAGVFVVRLYLGVLSTLLLLAAVRAVRRTFGEPYAAALLVFPGLVPVWLLFSYGAWGDLGAGLIVVLAVCELTRFFRGYVAGRPPGLVDGLRLGLLGIATVYLRSSTAPLVVGLVVLALAGLVVFLRGAARWRALGAVLAAAVVIVGLLLPWSVAASHSLGSRVVTTTTVPTALANTFGDRDELCYGPCDPGSSMWFSPVRYARETARATGAGEVQVLAQMSTYARQDVTAHGYAGQVLNDFDRYTLQASGYEDNFRPHYTHRDTTADLVDVGTNLLYYPFLAFGILFMLLAVRGPVDRQLRVIGLKLVIAALMLQPFFHLCSSRYWPTFAPMVAFGTVILLKAWRDRRDPGLDLGAATTSQRVLRSVQIALSVGSVGVFVGLWAVSNLG